MIHKAYVISKHLERFSSVIPTAVVEIVQEECKVERLNDVFGDAGLTAIPDKCKCDCTAGKGEGSGTRMRGKGRAAAETRERREW